MRISASLVFAIAILILESVEAQPLALTDLNQFISPAGQPDSTQMIYVSSSTGRDTILVNGVPQNNPGTDPNNPVKTLAAGYDRLRPGHADWLRLKRGDTWTGEYFRNWSSQKLGPSPNHRVVVTSYGSGARPIVRDMTPAMIQNSDDSAFQIANNGANSGNIVISDLHIIGDGLGTANKSGIWIIGNMSNVLIENNEIEKFFVGIDFQATAGQLNQSNAIRLNIIHHQMHSGGSYGRECDNPGAPWRSQGIVIYTGDGGESRDMVIEGNLMHANGVSAVNGEGVCTAHNIYAINDNQALGLTNITVRKNIFTETDLGKLSARLSTVIEDNLFLKTAMTLIACCELGNPAVRNNKFNRNVQLDGNNYSVDMPRGQGPDIFAQNIELGYNVFAHQRSGTGQAVAIALGPDGRNPTHSSLVDVHDNIIYDWSQPNPYQNNAGISVYPVMDSTTIRNNKIVMPANQGLAYFISRMTTGIFSGNRYLVADPTHFFSYGGFANYNAWVSQSQETGSQVYSSNTTAQTGFPNPQFDIGTYMRDRVSGSVPSNQNYAGFIAAAMAQDRANFNPALTAPAVNCYIQRDGFGMTSNNSCDGAPEVSVSSLGTSAAAEAGLVPGAFRISLSVPAPAPLSVAFSMTGSAVRGSNYRLYLPGATQPLTSNIVPFAAGASSVVVTLVPINDNTLTGTLHAKMNLSSGTGYQVAGDSKRAIATVAIQDAAPNLCPGDFDNSHTLNINDYQAFQNAYAAGVSGVDVDFTGRNASRADGNADGVFNAADFQWFSNAYAQPCSAGLTSGGGGNAVAARIKR